MIPPKPLKSAVKKVTAVSKISKSTPAKSKTAAPGTGRKLSKSVEHTEELEVENDQVENEETIIKTPTSINEEEQQQEKPENQAEGEVTEQKEGEIEENKEAGEGEAEQQPQPVKKDGRIYYIVFFLLYIYYINFF